MNAKSTLSILALFAIAPAWAGGNDPVAELAERSGLSERKVQMVIGNRTAYAEYRYTYQRSLEKFIAAVGHDEYQRLVANGIPARTRLPADALALQEQPQTEEPRL
ncbi:hypothetical protein [Luteimonas vadosa]